VKGLPKLHSAKARQPKHKRRSHKKSQRRSSSGETNFTTLNTTNVQLIKDYFKTISPNIYAKLAQSGQYVLYQYEGRGYEIYLVPTTMSAMAKQINKHYPLTSAGIHLGFMRRKKTHTHFERAFYLSYEGGRFLYQFIQEQEPSLKEEIQTISLDLEGEQGFLYGRNLSLDDITSETEGLQKKRLIFVLDRFGEYLGLALLMVKQAGAEPLEEGEKVRDDYSRSPHFILELLNLCDAGQYLRKGG
jgi:ribosome biogenesis protein Nip4